MHDIFLGVLNMDYIFECDSWGASFNLPYAIINNINDCTGQQLKVLLCIFAGSRITDSDMLSQMAGVSADEADAAVKYWCEKGVIRLSGGELVKPSAEGAHRFSGKNEPVSLVEAVKPNKGEVKKKIVVNYSPKDIAEKIENDSNLKRLSSEIQSVMGIVNINKTELAMLCELYEVYKFDVNTVLLVASYCVSAGKSNVAYLHTVMVDWFNAGINTYTEVEGRICELEIYREYESKVLRLFGVTNKPSKQQKDLISSWKAQGISLELLEEAYDKCLNEKSKLSFPFINGIIKNWVEKNITNIEQVRIDDEKHRSAFKAKENESKHSYDLSEIENYALNFGLDGNTDGVRKDES